MEAHQCSLYMELALVGLQTLAHKVKITAGCTRSSRDGTVRIWPGTECENIVNPGL